LLEKICAGPLQSSEELEAAGAFDVPETAASSKKKSKSKA